MEKTVLQPLVKYIQEWTKTCYNRAAAENFLYYACLQGVEVKKFKNKRIQNLLEKSLRKQMHFLSYIAACKMMENHSRSNLLEVKKWIAQNKFHDSYPKRKPVPDYIITFHLADGYRLLTYCDRLDEIDFQDVYSATFFTKLTVYNKTWKYLTQARLEKVMLHIENKISRDDLFHVEFHIDEEFAPCRKNRLIHLHCDVEGMPDFVQYAKMMKIKELFGFLISDVFIPEENFVNYC